MATITPAKLTDLAAVKKAVNTLRKHQGRILVGANRQERIEVNQETAIFLAITHAGRQQHRNKLYLLPAPSQPRIGKAEEWQQACNRAEEALGTLLGLQADATAWKDNLGQKGQKATRDQLEEVCKLELTQALEIAQRAASTAFPRGFGRD